MRMLAITLLGLCLIGCEQKEMPDSAPPTAAQRVCKVDGDCILADISCNGCCQRESINKKDSAGYIARKEKICVGKQTSVCDCVELPAIAKCQTGQCVLVLAQTRADSLRSVYGDSACCTFTEGDIIREDRLSIAACLEKTGGTPGIVDPLRLTPHPCCPNAKGERCGP